ncbi:MAG TPA: hypothetical protein VFS89_03295 [Nitrosospira sp.]|nr:hypothetical protein [Nitrosospira sp.]
MITYSAILKHYLIAALLALIAATAHAADTKVILDTAQIERVTGLKGTYSEEETFLKYPSHALT